MGGEGAWSDAETEHGECPGEGAGSGMELWEREHHLAGDGSDTAGTVVFALGEVNPPKNRAGAAVGNPSSGKWENPFGA